MSGQGMSRRAQAGVVAGGALALCTALGGYFATPAFAYTGTLTGTPCTVTARACVDLDHQKAWLASGGKVTGGPFDIASGGQGKETPMGTFHVINKVQDFKSTAFPLPNGQPAPMPFSVFFEPGGIAFHSGNPDRASAGCIHLMPAAAQTFFATLSVGDEVQVTQSTSHLKGGFYGVHHLTPPGATTKTDSKSASSSSEQKNRSSSDRKKTGANKK